MDNKIDYSVVGLLLLFQNALLEAQMAGCRIVETGQVELVVTGTVVGIQIQIDIGLAPAEQAVIVQRRDGAAMRDGLHVILVDVIRFKKSALTNWKLLVKTGF